jgi:transcriptional regulator with XRE-family HTH domain
VKLSKLKDWRERRGLSQQALSEKSGVARDGISHYENGTRDAHPGTVKRLADALGVEVKDLMKGDKVEVEVGVMDEGVYRGEILRFTGELIDSYERGDIRFELYECPNGYRVYVDNGSQELGSYLHPYEKNRYTGELEYRFYTAEEVAEEWPEFGSSVGALRVRDID